ncbi:Protein CAJ1 [Glycine max]|nr:Protein CAJ1 [Glycine max]
MDADEAKILLGFPPNSRPTPSQVKSAYKKKVWESHPDLFPSHEKPLAESKFKLISEAYTCLESGGRGGASSSVDQYSHVVRTGFPRAHGGRKNHAMIKVPFLLIILGTLALGGFNASSDIFVVICEECYTIYRKISYVLSDEIGVVDFGNTTVVNVPPHRNLGRRVSCGCMTTHHLTIAFIFLENHAN